MATIKVILWSILILAGVGYYRYAHAEPLSPAYAVQQAAR